MQSDDEKRDGSSGSGRESGEDGSPRSGAGARGPQLAGKRFGRFRLVRELGHGGQGFVWLAEDEALKRTVALKLLTHAATFSEKSRLRFLREAEVASRLDHPGICGIHEVGETDGVPWIAMQYIEGEPLDRVITTSKVGAIESAMPSHVDFEASIAEEPEEDIEDHTSSGPGRNEILDVLRLIESAARALHVAHEAGLVHRDIKPGNIIVGPDRRAVLLDFGLARDEESGDATLTQSGELLGTPAYMSPEQISGGRTGIDRRSDVYSLGVTFYECLCLARPFEASSRQELYRKISHEMPADLRKRNPAVSHDIAVVVGATLEKNPDRRYQTALDLAEDLRRIREREPILARPPGPLVRVALWARRNPAIAAATIVVAVITTIAFAMILESRDEEVRAKNEALTLAHANRKLADEEREARRQAEYDAESARQIHEFLVALFQESDPIALSGRAFGAREMARDELSARDVLDRGAAKLEEDLRDRPAARAYLLDAIGNVYLSLGLPDEAEPLIAEALEIRRGLYPEDHIDFVRSCVSQALLACVRGNPRADELGEILATKKDALRQDKELHRRCATLHAIQLVIEYRIEEAEKALPEALELAKDEDGGFGQGAALVEMAWAQLRFVQDRDLDGMAHVKRAAEAMDRSSGSTDFTDLMMNLMRAQLLARSKQHAVADRIYASCVEKGEELFGADHFFSALVMTVYGEFLVRDMQAPDRAAEILTRAIDIKRNIFGENSHLLPSSLIELARSRRDQGRNDETIALILEAERIARNNEVVERKVLATALHILAVEYREIDRFDEAIELLLEVIAIRRKHSGDDYKRTKLALRNLEHALLLREAGAEIADPVIQQSEGNLAARIRRARSHALAVKLARQLPDGGDRDFIVGRYESAAITELEAALAGGADPVALRGDEDFEHLREHPDLPAILR